MGGTKARLKRKGKVVGVKMRGQLEMDKFLQDFTWDRKSGDEPEVGWICTVISWSGWMEAHFHWMGNCE